MSAAIAPQPKPSTHTQAFISRPARLLIGGEWVESAADSRVPVYDPATGAVICEVVDAGQADVDRAVAAAREAFEKGPWATMLPAHREALIWRLSDLIEQHADELGARERINNGNTKAMAGIVDVPHSRNYFPSPAGWAAG